MKILSQLDLKWASDKLGASNLTVGRYGCTTTCISMLSDYFGSYLSPAEIARVAKNYNSNGEILWPNLYSDKMKWTFREYGRNDKNIRAAAADPNRGVIVRVNNGQHWVLILAPTILGNDYKVADPNGGVILSSVLKKYKNIDGAAYFERKNPATVSPVYDFDLAKRLSGQLLIVPELGGKLFFVDTLGKKHDLGNNAEEVRLNVGKLALGISIVDLNKLPPA